MKTKIIKTVLFVLCLAGPAGCMQKGLGESCDIDSDCRDGLICHYFPEDMVSEDDVSGTCRHPCWSDDDCDGRTTCAEGNGCVPMEGEADAETDADAEDVTIDEPVDVPQEDVGSDAIETPDVTGDCSGRDVTVIDGQCMLPEEFGVTFKMTMFNVGENGFPGSGLDMDGSASTCAPMQDGSPPLCSNGIDNAMAQLGPMGNPSLDLSIAEGTMNIIFELNGYDDSGCPFNVDFLTGILVSGEPGCVNEGACEYAINEESFDEETCIPVSSVGDAFIWDGDLTAGETGTTTYMFDAVIVGMHILIPVLYPRIEATVRFSGGDPTAIDGVLGGIIRKQDFFHAFEVIPIEEYPEGVTKDDILEMWREIYDTGQFELDFDLDSDTTPDSSSLGIFFTSLPVYVSGTTAPEE